MTQVSSCPPRSLFRPDLTERFDDVITAEPQVHYPYRETPRRADGLLPKFGTGIPTSDSHKVDIYGIAQKPRMGSLNGLYESVQTMEGSVKLPIDTEQLQYTPTASTLDFLTHHQGTRLSFLPHRYFHR